MVKKEATKKYTKKVEEVKKVPAARPRGRQFKTMTDRVSGWKKAKK